MHGVSLPNRAETKNHNDNHDDSKKKNKDYNNTDDDNNGKEDHATNAPTTAMPMAIRLTTPARRKTKTMEQRAIIEKQR